MHSCFYSTAYWEKPYELKMADKQWLGADLILTWMEIICCVTIEIFQA